MKDFTTILSNVFEGIYVYCHLQKLNYIPIAENTMLIIKISLLGAFIITISKFLINLTLFILISLLFDMLKGIYLLLKNCRMIVPISYVISYILKKLKKIFTYNFYIYQSKAFGYIIVLIYLTFIVSNAVFISTNYAGYPNIVLRIISFELHLFIEFYCGFFFIFKGLFCILGVTTAFVIIWNIIIFGSIITYTYLNDFDISDKTKIDETEDYIRYLLHLGLMVCFIAIYSTAYSKMKKYNLNCNNN